MSQKIQVGGRVKIYQEGDQICAGYNVPEKWNTWNVPKKFRWLGSQDLERGDQICSGYLHSIRMLRKCQKFKFCKIMLLA